MRIRTRLGMSADGYVTTLDGWPSHSADLTPDTRLTLKSEHALPGGAVEIVYTPEGRDR